MDETNYILIAMAPSRLFKFGILPLLAVVVVAAAVVTVSFHRAVDAEDGAPAKPVNTNALALAATDKVLGSPDAPVTIIEYASLSCPHCAHFHKDVFPELRQKYIDTGKVKFAFRHFPLNEPALKGAMLTECVPQEQFYNYLKVLFGNQDKWAFDSRFIDQLGVIATVGGMGKGDFSRCMNDTEREKHVLLSRKIATDQLQVASTPTFFVNGRKLDGLQSITQFDAAIAALAGK